MQRRRFVQGVCASTFLPGAIILPLVHAGGPDLRERISTIISEYSAQGYHRTGTDVDNKSAIWLAGHIQQRGLTPEISSFPFRRLKVDKAKLNIGSLSIEAVPFYDCLYTGAKGITGSLGMLGTDADIGVVMSLPYGGTPVALSIEQARHKAQHKAIVVVTDSRMPETGIATFNAERYEEPFGPPVIQIASEFWERVKQSALDGGTANLVAQCHYVNTVAKNVGATLKGTNPDLPPLVIMTPRTGWWTCASERGGGLASFLEMMSVLVEKGSDRDVIFTANTGHELGHVGLEHYLNKNPELAKEAQMWIHLGANFAAQVMPAIRIQYSSAAVKKIFEPIVSAHNLSVDSETPMDEKPLGEARNIYDGGGNYISILSRNGLFHHPADTWPDAVNLDLTTGWVRAFVQLAIALTRG